MFEVEIFQCDLAKTVSKYIGETEKNLDLIFDAAEKARAVLVFNEADVDAALAATVFHSGQIAIPALKRFLEEHGTEVRP